MSSEYPILSLTDTGRLPMLRIPYPGSNEVTVESDSGSRVLSLAPQGPVRLLHTLANARIEDPENKVTGDDLAEQYKGGAGDPTIGSHLLYLKKQLPGLIDSKGRGRDRQVRLIPEIIFTAATEEEHEKQQPSKSQQSPDTDYQPDAQSRQSDEPAPGSLAEPDSMTASGVITEGTQERVLNAVKVHSLVERTQDGDLHAANDLAEELLPLITRYCRARLGGRDIADDVAQEVMISTLKSLTTYEDRGKPFFAYMYGIASKKIIDVHRKKSRSKVDLVEEVPEKTTGNEPEEHVLALDSDNRARWMLDRVSAYQREILILRIVHGLSAEETAKLMDTTPGAVRIAQHRAITKLRKAHEAGQADPEDAITNQPASFRRSGENATSVDSVINPSSSEANPRTTVGGTDGDSSETTSTTAANTIDIYAASIRPSDSDTIRLATSPAEAIAATVSGETPRYEHPYEYVKGVQQYQKFNRRLVRDKRTGTLIKLSDKEAELLLAIPVSTQPVHTDELARVLLGAEYDRLDPDSQLAERKRITSSAFTLRKKLMQGVTQFSKKSGNQGGYHFNPSNRG